MNISFPWKSKILTKSIMHYIIGAEIRIHGICFHFELNEMVHVSSVSIPILERIPVALMYMLRWYVYLSWKVFRLH